MFPFHFKNFVGNLDIQYPNYEGIPNDSPIFIFYREESDLSKHEILRRFYKILQNNNITYLRPSKNLTGEWVFNLKEFRHTFDCLKDVEYLQGSIKIEPEYFRKVNDVDSNEENLKEETSIKFSVYKEDLHLLKSNQIVITEELSLSLKRFKKDYPITEKLYADVLFENIKTYMQGCTFGIALFDRINTDDFNPNVSLEIGYMMALSKPVLLL